MEMLISPDWLRRKVESDPDVDTDAGPSMAANWLRLSPVTWSYPYTTRAIIDMWRYLKFSNLKVSLDFNPFCWSFIYHYSGPTKLDPNLSMRYLRILPLSIVLVIDNGVFVTEPEVLIEAADTVADIL